MDNNNNKKSIQIAELKKDIGFLLSKITALEKQVSNDISHKLCDLRRCFNDYKLANAKLQTGILVSIILLLLATILNLLK